VVPEVFGCRFGDHVVVPTNRRERTSKVPHSPSGPGYFNLGAAWQFLELCRAEQF
jgi:hypothetical protein